MFDQGTGVAQSYEEALRYYNMAAELGEAHAICNLGRMYEQGHGVTQSDEEAVRLYQIAANQGSSMGQYNLAGYFRRGCGVAQSDEEAVRWMRKAAEQVRRHTSCWVISMRVAGAQYNLGLFFQKGRGTAQSDAEAARWYRAAAEQGDIRRRCSGTGRQLNKETVWRRLPWGKCTHSAAAWHKAMQKRFGGSDEVPTMAVRRHTSCWVISMRMVAAWRMMSARQRSGTKRRLT